MAIERRLTELVGPVGGKLHTARSRNDQVATDMAMFVRAHAHEAEPADHRPGRHPDRAGRAPPGLADARLHPPAARPAGVPEPPPAGLRVDAGARPRAVRRGGRGHGQRCRSAPGRWPGSTSTPTAGRSRPSSASPASPRTRSTRSPTATSCSTTWRRPPPAPPTCPAWAPRSCCGPARSSRFCEVSDAWASGSSIMPQKKNPDAAELLRAKAPRVVGSLAALHGVMHGLPLTYNKDMQEDKERLFDACDTLELSLEAAAGDAGDDQLQPRAAGGGGGRSVPGRHRRRRPAGPAGDALSRGPRRGRRSRAPGGRSGQAALGADPARAGRAVAAARRRVLPRCSSDGAWLESKVSEGGTSLGRVREQLDRARAALA